MDRISREEESLDAETTIAQVRAQVADFIRERDWEKFHNPKDLASAIAIEASELQELFLWKSGRDLTDLMAEAGSRAKLEQELADVLIYCLSMANQCGVDVSDAIASKLELNRTKYPTSRAFGRADKYTSYAPEVKE